MYAVSRVAIARPEGMTEVPEFLLTMAGELRSRFDYDVTIAAEDLGVVGRFAISSRWASLADRQQRQAQVMADPWFAQQWARAAELFQPSGQDFVFMTLDGAPMPEPGPVNSMRSAVARAGRLREAAAYATEISGMTADAVGLDVTPVMMRSGATGTFAWIVTADSMAELEAAFHRFMGDETIGKSVDDAAELWIEGSSTDSYWMRLG